MIQCKEQSTKNFRLLVLMKKETNFKKCEKGDKRINRI